MGRPINKRYFGALTDATAKSATNPTQDGYDQTGRALTNTTLYSEKKLGYNIPVLAAYVPGVSEVVGGEGAEYPYIVAQKASRAYTVRTSATAAHVGKCRLANKAIGALAAGEMVIQGKLSTDDNVVINIAKLTKFYATDFSGNRYKWHVEPYSGEDSSQANALILTVATTAGIN